MIRDKAVQRSVRPIGEIRDHYWKAQRMAKSAGLDLAQAQTEGLLPQEDWADIVTSCRKCGWVEGCHNHLNRPDAQGVRALPEGCPNADRYSALLDAMTIGE